MRRGITLPCTTRGLRLYPPATVTVTPLHQTQHGVLRRSSPMVNESMMNLPATAACPRPFGRAAGRKAPRRRLHFLVPLLFVAVTTLTGAAAPAPPVDHWQAGVATVDVTPPLPAWLSGYGNRVAPAKTVTEPLRAKALAIKDRSGTTLVAITTDLLGVPRAVRDAVAEELQRKYQLPGAGLLINASHTHCGPEIRSAETQFSTLNPQRTARVAEYRAQLVAQLAEVAGAALSSLEPVHLAYSHAKAGFAMNRRPNYALVESMPGYGVEPNPDGPVDHAVPVLQVRNGKG